VKPHTPFRFATALLLALALPCAGPGRPHATQTKKDAVPFQCFTIPWHESFQVVSSHYERPGHRVVWVLRAKKDSRVPSCYAHLSDGDGMEMTRVKVKFAPDRPTVKAGVRIQAIVPVGAALAADVARIIVRERR
jgi:hypothetical protein